MEATTSFFKCEECDAKYRRKIHLNRHINHHHVKSEYKCDTCSVLFTRKDNLTRHIREKHSGVTFTCDVCFATFKASRVLSEHREKFHHPATRDAARREGVYHQAAHLYFPAVAGTSGIGAETSRIPARSDGARLEIGAGNGTPALSASRHEGQQGHAEAGASSGIEAGTSRIPEPARLEVGAGNGNARHDAGSESSQHQKQQNGSQVFEGQQRGREAWMQEEDPRFANTPPDGQFPMQNGGHVKFEVPKVPVIFVLGGPGSGKVTHCDNLMQEKRGITHINMTDLLQQYAIGNDMKDFGQLSSRTVTEVLMLEMKMAPAAKTYLVSGYPRNMRDVVEYSDKIQVVNGVILVSWRQKVLERQIDYGAKLGHVVLSLAKMELNNFYKNVMPVADYFDQRGMLYAVNGERNPSEVYKDFRSVVLQMLGMHEQGNEGPAVAANVGPAVAAANVPAATVVDKIADPTPVPYKVPAKGFPPVIWVIGGPGSNKSALCQKAVRQAPGWVHFSVGRLLRTTAETTDPRQGNDSHLVRQAISSGDMVPQTYVLQLVESQMTTNMSAQGILMDGFPRDMNQVYEFENKFKQQPIVILLDCSKLQLGRGRLDDSVAAFRRRLELFRELSLPMLKTLDNENRLTIVDGDTDTPAVQEDFNRVVLQQIEHLKRTGGMIVPQQTMPKPQQHQAQVAPIANGTNPMIPRQGGHYDTMVHDLETEDVGHGSNGAMPNGIPVNTISRQVAAAAIHHAGGQHIANGGPAGMVQNMRGAIPNGVAGAARHLPALNNPMEYTNINQPNVPGNRPSRDTIRDMYANVESYPMDPRLG